MYAFSYPHYFPHNLNKSLKSPIRPSARVSRPRPPQPQPAHLQAARMDSTAAVMTTASPEEAALLSEAESQRLYFCYGSNMVRDKLRHRGPASTPISFTHVWKARLPDWQLCFDLTVAPPQEPAMASIQKQQGGAVYGLVYSIATQDCWDRLIASEGITEHHGPYDAYHVISVEVECLDVENPAVTRKMLVHTLVSNPRLSISKRLQTIVRPSQRYMNLIIQGARQEQLPPNYIELLEAAPVARRWEPSLLVFLMNLTIPFMFLARKRQVRALSYPLKKLGLLLYAMHETLDLHSNEDTQLRNVQLWVCRACLFVLYAMYIVPSALAVMFSAKGRRIYNAFVTKNRAMPVSDKPEHTVSPS